jgi:hypothetical protein
MARYDRWKKHPPHSRLSGSLALDLDARHVAHDARARQVTMVGALQVSHLCSTSIGGVRISRADAQERMAFCLRTGPWKMHLISGTIFTGSRTTAYLSEKTSFSGHLRER